MAKKCMSCNSDASEGVEFKCPGCLKETIVRCNHCRGNVKSYQCPNCNFTGP